MKKCHKCNIEKVLDEFPRNVKKKDGRSETCLVCKREYNRKHYTNNKKYYIDKAQTRKHTIRDLFQQYKSEIKCASCGQDHPGALHFHHDDPKQKDQAVGVAVNRGWSLEKIMAEVRKCTVLCGSCHGILHWEELHGKWSRGCGGSTALSEGAGDTFDSCTGH